MIKPYKILFFFILTGIFLLPAVIFFPKDGIPIGPFELKMMSFQKIIGTDTVYHANISDIVKAAQNIDSLPDVLDQTPADSGVSQFRDNEGYKNTKPYVEPGTQVYHLAYNDAGKENLHLFFNNLIKGKSKKQIVRVLHYGDSQIEGDRITSYIREKLQSRFGGYGVGLLPALQPYESFFSITQSNTGNWERHTTFSKKDPKVPSNRYGALAAFSRFSPIQNDSIPFKDSILYQASISFSESKVAYSGVRKFRKLTIYYGHSRRAVSIKILNNGQVLKQDSLNKNVDYQVYSYTFPEYISSTTLEFSGYDSPDFYAIDLTDLNGISVDNIGLRGSSGTFFTGMDTRHLSKMYNDLNVGLVIMQFGGNVMPYIKDSAAVESYGRWFGSQLNLLHKLIPDASIVVIGPSDMSIKDGENYITYEFLPYVRTKLKNATLNAGFSYWDMYEAMGGYNSMPEWVKADPPLAGADYTHFTPRGAKLISNMFYNALMIEFPNLQNEEIKTGKNSNLK